jgi:hypothetical protein
MIVPEAAFVWGVGCGVWGILAPSLRDMGRTNTELGNRGTVGLGLAKIYEDPHKG